MKVCLHKNNNVLPLIFSTPDNTLLEKQPAALLLKKIKLSNGLYKFYYTMHKIFIAYFHMCTEFLQ